MRILIQAHFYTDGDYSIEGYEFDAPKYVILVGILNFVILRQYLNARSSMRETLDEIFRK